MKALTLTQPWASLVAISAKRFETRPWPTKDRGPLAIHAGKGLAGMAEEELQAFFSMTPFMEALLKASITKPEQLPRGAIICITSIVACHRTDKLAVESPERDFGDYSPDRYAWELGPVTVIDPIYCRGYQGLWDWKESA